MGLRNSIKRLKDVIEKVGYHYSLFGFHGLFLVTKGRLLRRQIQVGFLASGFPFALHLRLGTSDVQVFWETLVESRYDLECHECPKVIVDAGANIGLTSIFYASKYPQAKILAVEPEPANFEMLRKNTGSYPNITAVHAALWKGNCDVRIVDPGKGLWGFRTGEIGESPVCQMGHVRGVTLDNLMRDNDMDYIDLLKVDIEGAEKEVFENSSTWIGRVGAIAVELHDRFRAGCSDSVYAATKDFEVSCIRDETTFFQRGQNASDPSDLRRLIAEVPDSQSGRLVGSLPLSIESVA